MSRAYWMQRRDEILAFRDYVEAFDQAADSQSGVSLSESGHQLMETAIKLAFIERADEAVSLAQQAISYYEMALASESTDNNSDPLMSPVYQRLYYARWWADGHEPAELLGRAAEAFSHDLGNVSDLTTTRDYCTAAWLWLEAGEPGAAEPWIDLMNGTKHGGDLEAACSLLRPVSRALASREGIGPVSQDLLQEIKSLSAWGQPTAGTLWDALQSANVHRRLVALVSDFPELLLQIC